MAITIRGKPTAYVRERVCDCCGKVDEVRKDNLATTCGTCSRRNKLPTASAALKEKRNAARVMKTCSSCGDEFSVTGGREKYCSIECRKVGAISKRIHRMCKRCGKSFHVPPGVLSGKTNSSANFCSRQCYNDFLANEDPNKYYGCRWKRVRAAAKEIAPFCALCGTQKSIDVHHIVPYRISNENHQDNLISLCKRHHKRVELLTQDMLNVDCPIDDIWLVMNSILSEWQAATHQTLKSLGYRNIYGPRPCFKN